MKTPIGQCLHSAPRLRVIAVAVALLVVAADLWLSAQWYPVWTRALLAATAVVACLTLAPRDRGSLGIRILPIQPVAYWLRLTLKVAVVLLIPIAVYVAIAKWATGGIPVQRIPPQYAAYAFLHMCVIAPLVEEPIYRLALCFPTTGTFGPTAAILLSGATFAGLHFIYGNPSPDNFLAGYFLAWAYLKSGSIMVPIAIHSLGNSVALAAKIGAWYAA
jgi:uncharacterized protein